ncbi:hypothetical protein [Pontimonas sp.]|uniref:hypothetical protein n=1 Tax=Pontimonas sp. TaxID=2304492 RepID=UPI002870AAB6|nr:hypothetical protein [Pontimonas sp.]MDR9435161.1 hypothetical protein [Pontimonas sp.]
MSLIGLGLAVGVGLNVTLVPQIMTPRTPVFNGADIAENWEWRSMAIHSHSWWLWEKFPESTATHVGFVTPPGNPDALRVGMLYSQWMDRQGALSTEVDASLPPLDVSELGIRDALYPHHRVYSRIHCRSGQEMADRDTCYYFVSWSEELLGDDPPRFIGVLTNREQDKEEMALIEENLLRDVSPVPLEDLLSIDEIRPS